MDKATAFSIIRNALRDQKQIDCEKIIGEGAFGIVVKASKNGGEPKAIKVMKVNKDNMGKFWIMSKHQERELELLLRMKLSDNSNVLKYFESWLMQVGSEAILCITMELCSESLGSFVHKNKASPDFIQEKGHPRFYRHVFQQVLNGLHAIHSIGWVHRDIHPGNILVVNPNPQQISDIAIKIGDFGLARQIGIEFSVLPGGTIDPKYEKLTPFPHELYTAPELSTENYDPKVDLYSAGLLLYFISRYLDKNVNVNTKSVMNSEIKALREGKLEVNDYVCHNDDEKLCGLIKKLMQSNPLERPSALEAMEYMFPTQALDSTDSSKASTYEFLARKKDEKDVSLCFLKELTLSAVVEEVRSRIGVSELARENLRQERVINGKTRRIKIDCDKVVEAMFRKAASDGSDVEIVVLEQPQEDRNDEMEQIQPEQEKDETSNESL